MRNLFLLLWIFFWVGCTHPGSGNMQNDSKADSLYQVACVHYENNQLDSCAYIMVKALQLYRANGETEKAAIACLSLGQSYNAISETDSGRFYLLEGLEYCKGNPSLDSIYGRLLTDLGASDMTEGNIREATRNFLAAYNATRESGDEEAYLANCSSLGMAYRRSNMPDSAIYYYNKGLEAGMKSNVYSAVSNLHANLAVMYHAFGQMGNSKKHAQEAIAYALKEEDDEMDRMQAYYVYGALLVKAEEYDQAVINLRKAYAIASQQQATRFRLRVLSSLLVAFQMTAQEDSVQYYLKACDRYMDELPETSTEVIGIYETQAGLLMKEKKYREALELYHKLAVLNDINSPVGAHVAYSRMAECYHKLQQSERAYGYMKQAFDVRDSLAKQEIEKEMGELQVRYETQKKELEIKRLRELQQKEELRGLQRTIWFIASISVLGILLIVVLYKRKLQLSRKYIDGMESERARLARELHDGVCNELLGLEMEFKSESDCKVEAKGEFLDKLNRSRENIRRISHELMPPAFADTTIDEIIKDYIDHLNIPPSMHFSFDVSTSHWNMVSAKVGYELYRIVQECMNNILKHSSAGQVSLSLLMDGTHVRLEIFSSGAMKSSSSKGIGRHTIEDRVRCINGTLRVGADENGVQITVTAPVK